MMQFILLFSFAVGLSKGLIVNISNVNAKQDVSGMLMDAHDGTIMQWTTGGLYYFYAMGYQNCTLEHSKMPPQECPGIYKPFGSCGFRDDHAVRVYSSPDLVQWTLLSDNALPFDARPYGIYFRPKVIRNPGGLYLLWINHLPNASNPLIAYPDAAYVVASSDNPEGPFTVINEHVNLGISGAGDFSIMVEGEQAYIAYDAWGNNHQVVVEQLNNDFTDSLGASTTTSPLSPTGNEAPIMFSRGGWYYVLYGTTCCFCRQGAGAEVMVASHPLGPWSAMNADLNPRLSHSMFYTIPGQNSFIFRAKSVDGSESIIFVSDMWSSAEDDLKSHDKQYWQPLEFNDNVTPPSISSLKWIDWFLLDL